VNPDERGLVRRCLVRDQDAWTELVEKYAQMAGTVIWRTTGDHSAVEDLAQETFLRVFRGLPYFDARAKLSTWIYTIAHRVAVDHLRQARRSPEEFATGERGLADRPTPERNPETAAASEEIDRIVRDELARLPDKYRLPLVYAAIDALDYRTIGAMLKVRPATVKTLVFRGKAMLKARVDAVMQRATHRERSHAT
jgi:RNA polymerase sigma-70 factor, ECF subfamily